MGLGSLNKISFQLLPCAGWSRLLFLVLLALPCVLGGWGFACWPTEPNDDDDVYYYICERLKLEGETPNKVACAAPGGVGFFTETERRSSIPIHSFIFFFCQILAGLALRGPPLGIGPTTDSGARGQWT